MKKESQNIVWLNQIDLKKKELDDLINATLVRLNNLINTPRPNLNQISQEINTQIQNLKKEVDKKLTEIRSIKPKAEEQVADDSFFKRNYDYTDSPYSNTDKLEKITD